MFIAFSQHLWPLPMCDKEILNGSVVSLKDFMCVLQEHINLFILEPL